MFRRSLKHLGENSTHLSFVDVNIIVCPVYRLIAAFSLPGLGFLGPQRILLRTLQRLRVLQKPFQVKISVTGCTVWVNTKHLSSVCVRGAISAVDKLLWRKRKWNGVCGTIKSSNMKDWLSLLEAIARHDSMAVMALWAAQLLQSPWYSTSVTNPRMIQLWKIEL